MSSLVRRECRLTKKTDFHFGSSLRRPAFFVVQISRSQSGSTVLDRAPELLLSFPLIVTHINSPPFPHDTESMLALHLSVTSAPILL